MLFSQVMNIDSERIYNLQKLLYFQFTFLVYFIWYFILSHWIDYLLLPQQIIRNQSRNISKLIAFLPIVGFGVAIMWYVKNLNRLAFRN